MTRAVLVALMLVSGDERAGAPRRRAGASHAMGLWTPHPEYTTPARPGITTRFRRWVATASDIRPGIRLRVRSRAGRAPSATSTAVIRAARRCWPTSRRGPGTALRLRQRAARRIQPRRANSEQHAPRGSRRPQGRMGERRPGLRVGDQRRRQSARLAVRCDFLMKVHQGTHSPDAFTNNLHELLYAAQCRDRGDGSVGPSSSPTRWCSSAIPAGSRRAGSPVALPS